MHLIYSGTNGTVPNFDYTEYKIIVCMADNGTTAIFVPTMFPSALLKAKEGQFLIIYGSQGADYIAVKYESTNLTCQQGGFTNAIMYIYGIK